MALGLISGQISYGYITPFNLLFCWQYDSGQALCRACYLHKSIPDRLYCRLGLTLISAWVPAPFLRTALLLAIGIVLMCFAASMYMTAISRLSLRCAAIIISNRSGKQFRLVRICTDTILVIIGTICVLCGGRGAARSGDYHLSVVYGSAYHFFNRKNCRCWRKTERKREFKKRVQIKIIMYWNYASITISPKQS